MVARDEAEEPTVATSSGPVAATGRHDLTPGRITAIYLVLGLLALVFSDLLLVRLVSEPLLGQLQALKGVVEVCATAGLIYVLTRVHQNSVERQAAELRRHRRELQVLHRVLRHNLRNNLTIIRGMAERLRDDTDDEEQRETCESVLAVSDEILHYTRRAEEIRRLTAGDGDVTVDLADVVPTVLESVRNDDRGPTVEVSVPDTAEVSVTPLFRRAVEELVQNAIEHTGEGAAVEVVVDPRAGPDGYTTLTVADDGPGLPEHVQRVLTEGEHTQLVHMDGMGLWLVYLGAVESGGRFVIEQTGPDGTTISLQVPTATDDRSLLAPVETFETAGVSAGAQ